MRVFCKAGSQHHMGICRSHLYKNILGLFYLFQGYSFATLVVMDGRSLLVGHGMEVKEQ